MTDGRKVTLRWLGRADDVGLRCLVESVEAELSVRAHVIFSCDGVNDV